MKLGLGRIMIKHLVFCPVFTFLIRKAKGGVRKIGGNEFELIDPVVLVFL